MVDKKIPLRNYIILALILILSIIMIVYFYMWYGALEKNRINTPLMDKYLNVINYNELEDYLIENKFAVLYASTLDDENIRNFEKKFKNIIYKYSLNNSILYLDLTSELKITSISNELNLKYNIKELPCILIFKNGIIYDIYNIKANLYDVDDLVLYLIEEEVIHD